MDCPVFFRKSEVLIGAKQAIINMSETYPLLVRGPWLASKPTLILGKCTAIFVVKLKSHPMPRAKEKHIGIYLLL